MKKRIPFKLSARRHFYDVPGKIPPVLWIATVFTGIILNACPLFGETSAAAVKENAGPRPLTAESFPDALEVGDGCKFGRIEDALAAAPSGAVIIVHALPDGKPYMRPAVNVSKPGIKFRPAGTVPVVLDGSGFEYSGKGSIPRAVFQFNKGSDGCAVEGFVIRNATNESSNGAGIRINQANGITIRNCVIEHNDMGIMSNGSFSEKTGADQLIEFCRIERNGSFREPGYNHNLYLGGFNAVVRNCEISRSLTGHNVKTRAHLNEFTANYVHDSANREFDIVDSKDGTDAPGSDAVLTGNYIVKDPECKGNHGTVHFGRDGGNRHNGALIMKDNVIVSPFGNTVVISDSAGTQSPATR